MPAVPGTDSKMIAAKALGPSKAMVFSRLSKARAHSSASSVAWNTVR